MNLKSDFPILQTNDHKGRPICFLDSAATSQKPQIVLDAMDNYYRHYNANIHRGIYKMSEQATFAYEEAHRKTAIFFNARSMKEIVFTRNATESINLVAYAWGRNNLKSGDLIILSEMEHHANLVPWQILAAEKDVRLEFIPVKDDFTLDLEVYYQLLEQSPKLVCCSGMSNVTGVIPPIKEMIRAAHRVGAIFLVDGAQMAPHFKVDLQDLDADFFVFSAHKMLGPTGLGVLYGREKLLSEMPPFLSGGDMISSVHLRSFSCNELPWKFEAGTAAIAEGIGFSAALDYLDKVGMDAIFAHEKALTSSAIDKISDFPGLKIFGPLTQPRGGTVSFTLDYAHPHDVAQILDEEGVCVRAGHHCAMPLHERFTMPATTRASFYLYNEEDDIDRLIIGLEKVRRLFE